MAEYEAGRELFDRTGDVVGSATAHNNIGEILSDQSQLDEARQRYERAEAGFRAANYPIGIAVTVSNRARTAARAGEHDAALQLLDDSMQRFEALRAGAYVLEQLVRRMECLLLAGRPTDASEVRLNIDRRIAQAGADEQTLAAVHRLNAWLSMQLGLFDAADDQLSASLRAAILADASYERALTLLVLGELHRQQGIEQPWATTDAWQLLHSLEVQSVAGWPNEFEPQRGLALETWW